MSQPDTPLSHGHTQHSQVGMAPTPSHSLSPGAHIHSPSLLTWATTPPSYWSPQHQPDLLLLQLGPSPSAAGNKYPPPPPPYHLSLMPLAHTPSPSVPTACALLGAMLSQALTRPTSHAPA